MRSNRDIDPGLSPEQPVGGDVHEFSERYKERKMKLLNEFHKENDIKAARPARRTVMVAAALLLAVAVPVAASASGDGRLFGRVWGRDGHADIPEHTDGYYDEQKDAYISYDIPAKEFVEADPATAERMIGDMSIEPMTVELGDTTMTITATARTKGAAVVCYTLEREGGVDMLVYSDELNNDKGAYFSDSATVYYSFGDSGCTCVDTELSTPEKLYCYDYIAGATLPLKLTITDFHGMTLADRIAAESEPEFDSRELVIPVGAKPEAVELRSDDGMTVSLSPISLSLPVIPVDDKIREIYTAVNGVDVPITDPYAAYYVAVNYTDGTKYTVKQQDFFDIYTFDSEIYNCAYSCGKLDGGMNYLFNRIVDTDRVESVTVNNVEFRLG